MNPEVADAVLDDLFESEQHRHGHGGEHELARQPHARLRPLLTMALPAGVMMTASQGTYLQFWTLFGASNQLLAALTLLSITVWLYQTGQRFAFTLAPAIFMFIVTIWALGGIAVSSFQTFEGLEMRMVNGLAALALIGLAVYLAATALVRARTEGQVGQSSPVAGR